MEGNSEEKMFVCFFFYLKLSDIFMEEITIG